MTAKEAVQTTVSYVAAALDNSIGSIGSGSGPLNHFHNVVAKPYAGYIYIDLAKNLTELTSNSYLMTTVTAL